jgi:hypothetical protein
VSSGGAPRLVVLRALGLGDFLTGVPALRALALAFADHERLLLAPAFVRPLAALLGDVVHEVVDTEGRGAPPATLPPVAHGADVAVNLHGRGPQSHAALLAAAPRRLVAFACPEAGHVDGPPWLAGEHEVERAGVGGDPGLGQQPAPARSTSRRRPAPTTAAPPCCIPGRRRPRGAGRSTAGRRSPALSAPPGGRCS